MAAIPEPNRRDLVMWSTGIVLAVVATLIASAAGARLGSALTGGVMVLVATVLAGLAIDAKRLR